MEVMSRKQVEEIRQRYPEGTRVRLIRMDDPYREMPEGCEGTVDHVDDIGTIHVTWDIGIRLGVVPGVDEISRVAEVKDTDRDVSLWKNEADADLRIEKDRTIGVKLKEQILAVRDTGLVNMFDVRGVCQVAEMMGFKELIDFVERDRGRYAEFILTGK